MREEGSGIRRRARLLNAIQEGRTEGLIPLRSAETKGFSCDVGESAVSKSGKQYGTVMEIKSVPHKAISGACTSEPNAQEISGLRKGQIY
jgi:hypothetical protein